uniref:guanylate cyclase n=1 Tax=Ditylenchus dipsaci TaxID=166011 RepID=A0A915CVH5_9BILA
MEKQGSISQETLKDGEDKSGANQSTSVLYAAPEMLKNREQNKRRGWRHLCLWHSHVRILFRALPFPEGTVLAGESKCLTTSELVEPFPSASRCGCFASRLLELQPEIRPSIRRVRLNTENYLKVKGSLVDQMIRMMEQYANNLEKLVQERTGMLEDANKRADKLLSQLLPAYVANELKMGRAVAPRTFKQASVMFSDIVGFTTICSSSTPIEVVTMLNTVYTGFDDLINKHEAYKVETIVHFQVAPCPGDAYMIVSGIPQENGIRHLMHLCDVALDIMHFLHGFEIPHRKPQRIRIRVGLHTGTVAAGVVGLTAPRYCLFGDTVNTASRMESTGLPEKIQISEQYKKALDQNYPEFRTTLRGKMDIKGKGECYTYWLDGKGDALLHDQEPEMPPPPLMSKSKSNRGYSEW